MKHKEFTIVCVAVVYLCMLVPTSFAQVVFGKGQTPNVVMILSDDQGWGDIGFNNPNVYSPNLDRLAAEGALLANNYVMPQCTPTRVALLTGRYPGRFGTVARQATNSLAVPLGTPTLATMFKESGYKTYLAGKWHLGSRPEHGPNHFGFDESYGSLAGAIGMYDHRYRTGTYEITWHRNHTIIPGYENGIHATDLVTSEAIRIIEQGDNQPFFLYLPFHAVHTSLDERGPFVNQPTQLDPGDPTRWRNEDQIAWFNDPQGIIQNEPDPEKRLLLAAVHHLDSAIGLVVAALERNNLRENTIIIFSSDNGPQVNWPGNAYPDDLKLTDFNQPIPMRGSKIDVYEGGIHVPGFINWPGKIKPAVITEYVHIVDWFPTLASLIKYKPQNPIDWDGKNIIPMLVDHKAIAKRDLYWLWATNTNRWALRYGNWKVVKYGQPAPAVAQDWNLYNLTDDPQEQNNIASSNPQILQNLHNRYLVQSSKDRN